MASCVIVVPCYNEAKRLNRLTFLAFARRMPDARFHFVNDGSTDSTAELLEQLCAALPHQFSRHDMPVNSGKAEAVRTGLLQAMQMDTELVGFWDADLATPLDAIPRFVDVMQERDELEIAVGARIPLLGHQIQRQPLRAVLSRVFARAASWALGLSIYDTQCGAKLFRVTPQLAQALAEPFRSGWIFDVELLARLLRLRQQAGMTGIETTIYECALDRWTEVAGSKVKPSDFRTAISEFASVYWRYLRPWAPPVPTPAVELGTSRRQAA